jgi:peptide/nickel transport system substrate-binding protein
MSVADVRKGAENYATRNANGTGPFKLVSREPDVRTVLEANSKWWDKPQHNVTRATYMPISNSATRMAALLSGEIDFAQPVPTQDINRLKADSNIKVVQSTEARVIFLGFDHKRDELLYGSVKDKNPFKDARVRVSTRPSATLSS